MNLELYQILIEFLQENTPTKLTPKKLLKLVVTVILIVCGGLFFEYIPSLLTTIPYLRSLKPVDYEILASGQKPIEIVLSFEYNLSSKKDNLWIEYLKGSIVAAQANSVELRLRQGDWQTFEDRIKRALQNHPKGIILNTLEGLSEETIQQLQEFNNVVVGDNPQTIFKSVRTDEFRLGVLVTQDLKQIQPLIKEAVILTGIPKTRNNDLRVSGLTKGLQIAKIPLKATLAAWWRAEDAYNRTSEIIRNYPNVNLIVCANDEMSFGVLDALRDLGVDQQIFITNFDFVPHTEELISQDLILASVDTQSYKRGSLSVRSLLLNTSREDIFITPLMDKAITKQNLAAYLTIQKAVNQVDN